MQRAMCITSVTTVEIKHITSPIIALAIVLSRRYSSFNNPGSYDCGMNFLGALGEYANTQPTVRGATLVCTWKGNVSVPLPWEFRPSNTPNVLYDFNGSGLHYQNNDPRYILPYGSSGLIVNRVHFDSDTGLIDAWLSIKGKLTNWLYDFKFMKNSISNRALQEIENLNSTLHLGSTTIAIVRGAA
jgi:hypothetical protein